MEDELPITVTSKGLFEASDKSSQYLFTKLEGWINFQGLRANWYADENLVVKMNIVILPEDLFLDNEVDRSKTWQTISNKDFTAIYHHDEFNTSFDSFIMLSNDEIEYAMNHGKEVESIFQNKLKTLVNSLVGFYRLESI